MTLPTQLARLAQPFPQRFIHGNPSGGGTYVSHDVVTQRLLAILGPFDWRIVEVIRGRVDERLPNPNGKSERARKGVPALDAAVVGVIGELTVTIDGRIVTVQEAGDCEEPHNWPHDGARMKDASSDAVKRCAMRIGLGLHLWSQEEYVLGGILAKQVGDADRGDAAPAEIDNRQAEGGDLGEDPAPDRVEHAGPEGIVSPSGPAPLGPLVSPRWVTTFVMACKEIGWDDDRRHAEVLSLTGGRTQSCRELTLAEGATIRSWVHGEKLRQQEAERAARA